MSQRSAVSFASFEGRIPRWRPFNRLRGAFDGLSVRGDSGDRMYAAASVFKAPVQAVRVPLRY